MSGALHAELLSTRKRPGVWVIGAAWTSMAVAFGMAVPYIVYLAVTDSPPADREKLIGGLLPDQFVSGTVGLYPMFGSALMLILGVVVTGGDYRWGTWGTLLAQRAGRTAAVLGKAGATAVALLCITASVMAATAVASTLIAVAADRPQHWPGATTVLGGFGAAWLISMAAASLGMFLAILFRGTGAAIGAGLVWLLAVENLVSGIAGSLPALEPLQRLLISPNGGSLAIALAPVGAESSVPGLVSVSGPLPSSLLLAGYVLVFLGLSNLLITRRDSS
jgi:ABC-type transport system involved in multi-copper enzyme maturation permease subunit